MILIVEDDVDISRLMKHHLEVAGYEVRAYASAFGVLPGTLRRRRRLACLRH